MIESGIETRHILLNRLYIRNSRFMPYRKVLPMVYFHGYSAIVSTRVAPYGWISLSQNWTLSFTESRKLNLVIIQVIYVYSVVLLIVRPSIANPTKWVVVDVFIVEVLPSRLFEYFHRV